MVPEASSVSISLELKVTVPGCLVKGIGLLIVNGYSTQTFGVLNCLGHVAKPALQPNSIRRHAARVIPNFRQMARRLSSCRIVPETPKSGCVTVMARTPCRLLQWGPCYCNATLVS